MHLKKSVKRVLCITGIVLSILLISLAGTLIFYKVSLGAVGTDNENVTFKVNSGSSKKEIVNNLYDARLIKNKIVGYIYLKTHNNIVLQAGEYSLNRKMNMTEIINALSSGDVIDNSVTITFVEGKKITYYAKEISNKFSFTEDEFISKINDKEFLQKLVNEYWFLTDDILNDKLYYALEGYLFPDTYQFDKDISIEEIIRKLLDQTEEFLNQHKSQIENSKYNVHEILTMASIVELEGANSNDRAGVSGVFYNRLNNGWSLGSDVTAYYGAKVEMSERNLYQQELNASNNYNTRIPTMAGKLPVGPICNPSNESIIASLNPEEHNYFYFVADKNKKTYFASNYNEFINTINKLKNENLWYEY